MSTARDRLKAWASGGTTATPTIPASPSSTESAGQLSARDRLKAWATQGVPASVSATTNQPTVSQPNPERVDYASQIADVDAEIKRLSNRNTTFDVSPYSEEENRQAEQRIAQLEQNKKQLQADWQKQKDADVAAIDKQIKEVEDAAAALAKRTDLDEYTKRLESAKLNGARNQLVQAKVKADPNAVDKAWAAASSIIAGVAGGLSAARETVKEVATGKGKESNYDPNSKSAQLLDLAAKQKELAVSEASAGGKVLGEAIIGIGQTAALSSLAAINPSLPLVAMAAVAAGNKANEVKAQGGTSNQALVRGTISGGIEAATEKLPLDALVDLVKVGGKSALKNLMKQAGMEATEESVSYVANWIVDKAFKDPNATFSWAELGQAAAGGLLSGGLLSGSAMLLNRTTDAGEALTTEKDLQKEAEKAGERSSQEIPVNENGLYSFSAHEVDNLSSGSKNKIISTISDTISFVRNAIANKQNVDRAYLGKVPDSVARTIKDNTGIDVSGFSVMMNGNDIRHIFKHHGDPLVESARDQVAVTPEDIALIPQIISDPDSIKPSNEKDNKGRKVVIFEKQIGDKYVTIQGVSDGKHLIEADTLYIKKQKNSSDTGHDVASSNPVINAQSVPLQSSSNTNIPGQHGNVNPHVEMLPTFERTAEQLPIRETKNATGHVNPDDSVGAAPAGFDPYGEAMLKYGQLNPGENPARIVDNPAAVGDQKVSQTVQTATEAAATPESMLGDIADEVMSGKTGLTYLPISNKQTVAIARATLQRKGDPSAALADWTARVRSGETSEVLTAMGALLYNDAVNSGNKKLALSILSDYASTVRRGSRAMQAARILKTLSPEDKLVYIMESVGKLNEKIENTARQTRKRPSETDNVPVDLWMQKVGEDLADKLEQRLKASKSKAKTVSETVMADLRKHLAFLESESKAPASEAERAAKRESAKQSRIDSLINMVQNSAEYNEAWEAAKATISDAFEKNPDALDAFNWWLNESLTSAKRLVKELTGQTEIIVGESLASEYLNAKTDSERDAALDKIYQNIADQIPSSIEDKFVALRYLNMLGNLKTQVRNFFGNLFNAGVRKVDRAFEALIQKVAYRGENKSKRTTTLTVDKGLKKLAKSDFEAYKAEAMGARKYTSGNAAAMSEIDKKRTIFKNNGTWGTNEVSGFAGSLPVRAVRKSTDIAYKGAELARNITSKAMEIGDEAFAKSAYADSMARYLKAKGYTAEQWQANKIPDEVLDEARGYAAKEAREATFRDRNAFSDAIASIGFKNADTGVKKAINVMAKGTAPFLFTPANVLYQAEKHSPVGLLNTAVTAAKAIKGAQDITGTDVIKSLSENLTGLGLVALGAALAKAGIATGSEAEEEEFAEMENLTGSQAFAINLPNGESYTYDFATPASMPFAVGVELYNAAERHGLSSEALFEAIGKSTNIVLEMSMLSGLNDAIEKVSYSDRPIVDLALNSVVAYFTQGLTSTLGGQLERTLEPERMTTFKDKESKISTGTQGAVGKVSAKVPGVDFQQIPYIDAWGRTDDSGSLAKRALENFVSPGYVSTDKTTETDEEIKRLLGTGQTGVAPNTVFQSYKVTYKENPEDKQNQSRYMTSDEYVQFAKTKGQTSFDIASAMIDTDIYKNMTDEEKANAIKRAYSYANHVASEKITDGKHDSDAYVEAAQKAQDELGLPEAEFLLLYEKYGGPAMNGDGVRDAYASGLDIEDYLDYNAGRKAYDADKNESYTIAETNTAIKDSGLSEADQVLLWLVEKPEWSEQASKIGVSAESYAKYKVAVNSIVGKKNSANIGKVIRALDIPQEDKRKLLAAN